MYWHLEYRSQVRCVTSYNTGQHPTTKNYLTPSITGITVEKPQAKVSLTIEQTLHDAHIQDDKNNLVAVTSN